MPLVGSVEGRLTVTSGQPIGGATLLARGGSPNVASTDGGGHYKMDLAPGPYDLSASAINFQEVRKGISIEALKPITVDFQLAPSMQGLR
jgi:hypothetical protein